jgi:cysteine desulfurase
VRDAGIEHLLKEIPQAVLNGPTGEDRLANNINISIPGLDTEFATVVLDKYGFAVSTRSACAGAGGGESVVVKAISSDPALTTSAPEQAWARATATLRLSLSPDTTFQNLKDLTKILKTHIEKMSTLTN